MDIRETRNFSFIYFFSLVFIFFSYLYFFYPLRVFRDARQWVEWVERKKIIVAMGDESRKKSSMSVEEEWKKEKSIGGAGSESTFLLARIFFSFFR